MHIKNVCVFCASSRQTPEKWISLARETGAALARGGVAVVYGGASIGMMGAMADAAIKERGQVTGVIPQWLKLREVAHGGLHSLVVTKDMHERKMTMYGMSDAFLILPGGLGTLEEALEIITWKHLGLHLKPILLMNKDGYFDSLINQFRVCVDEKLMSDKAKGLWNEIRSPGELMDMVKTLNFQA